MPGTGTTPPCPSRVQRLGQFRNEPVQMAAVNTDNDRMGQGRASLLDRHNQQTVRPATFTIKPKRQVTSTHPIDPQVIILGFS